MSPNPRYEAGRRFEYRVINKLRGLGWECLRSAGSHTKVDIVAWSTTKNKVLFIQCKKDGALLPADKSILVSYSTSTVVPILARTIGRSVEFIELVSGDEYNTEIEYKD